MYAGSVGFNISIEVAGSKSERNIFNPFAMESQRYEGLVASTTDPPTVSDIMHQAISERVFPGGAVAFGTCTVPLYYQSYGTYTYEVVIPAKEDSIWDLGSLTKIMVTTPAIMLLYDRQLLELDALACQYVPEFGNNGKQSITIRHLLSHTAGLREFYPFFDMGMTQEKEVLDYILNDKLCYNVAEATHYSDLSMIVLGLIVERVSGLSLDVFVSKEIFERLGMRHTCFRPIHKSEFSPMVVPTEVDFVHRNRLLWGEVHDPTAFLLEGVAGHAGLFSTVIDVCRFAQMMLAGGIDLPTNHRLFSEKTVKLFTTPGPTTPLNPRPFALGWDVSVRRSFSGYTSAGSFLGPRTFGHTGFTGTSLWIDPDRNFFVVLLTNAVHPTAAGGNGFKIKEVRPKVADTAVIAMSQQAFPHEVLLWHLEPAYRKLCATQNLQPKNVPSSLGMDSLHILSTSRVSSGTEESMAAIKNYKRKYENVSDLTNTSALSTVLDNDKEIPKKQNNQSYVWGRLFSLFFIAIISFIMP